ncbi:MAG TPA: hypothetical protein VFJ22_19300 [Dermatophilaceae bacterium]|nr:hypothetical protein [Dermatophilaceae bacterium]
MERPTSHICEQFFPVTVEGAAATAGEIWGESAGRDWQGVAWQGMAGSAWLVLG